MDAPLAVARTNYGDAVAVGRETAVTGVVVRPRQFVQSSALESYSRKFLRGIEGVEHQLVLLPFLYYAQVGRSGRAVIILHSLPADD
jgi:hypothetical protein